MAASGKTNKSARSRAVSGQRRNNRTPDARKPLAQSSSSPAFPSPDPTGKAYTLPPFIGVTGANEVPNYSQLKTSKGGVSMHPAVRAMADKRTRDEGYPSRAAYLSGLVVFDYYCRRRHWLTSQLMREPIAIREKVFQELLSNPGQSSSWFEHRIDEIVKEKTK